MRTLATSKKGDIISATDGSKAMILYRIENVICRSAWYRYDVYGEHFTVEDGLRLKYKLLYKGKYPMTRKELENLIDIKITN